MIEVKNVCKSFSEREVLHNINVTFDAGKTNLIIGQSGSGKTVLLKSLCGLHDVTSGDIIFDNICFTALKLKEKKNIRKGLGMIFQGGALFDFASVRENIRFPLEMFSGLSAGEMDDRVDWAMERVKLTNAGNLFPRETSGGMQKRISIARAIVLKPRYLFCDEPNSGLDPYTSILMDNLIGEITKELEIVTIINTHDMNSVMEIGDKILFIKEGYSSWIGNKDTVLQSGNKDLDDFVFASAMAKKVKQQYK